MKLIRMTEATEITGLSRSTILRLEKLGRFPKRKQLSLRTFGWLLNDIESWLKGKTHSYEGDDS